MRRAWQRRWAVPLRACTTAKNTDYRRFGSWVSRFGAILAAVSGGDARTGLHRRAERSVRVRSDQGRGSRLPELAAELVRLKVDLIVTWFTPAAQAAKQATHEIPIVMALAGNPVETGLVESLARPGGNITGMAGVAAELAGKCVELIRDMLPTAH